MPLTNLFDTDDKRWKALIGKNPAADGSFFYAVKTTGIYCRPSCSARKPNRANAEYFTSRDGAERAGYRPCKKCSPQAPTTISETEQKIIQACRTIEESTIPMSLAELAAEAQLSIYHFQRLFKKLIGITPKQYATSLRSKRFRKELTSGSSVTDAIYAAGFGSSSSAYRKSCSQLAMDPKIYRKGAPGETITFGIGECFLGLTLVAATAKGICSVEFGKDLETLRKQLHQRFPKARLEEAGPDFTSLLNQVLQFIEHPEEKCDIPLDIRGTVFQQQVWNVLHRIKPGETLSYSEVAEQIGNPGGVRAVASACGANRLPVLIPCHRVIAKDGKPGGYHWGEERKKMLLESEKKED